MDFFFQHVFSARHDPERSQALTRVGVVAVVALVTTLGALFGDHSWIGPGLSLAYLTVSAGWTAFVSRYPGHFPARRLLMMCSDIGLAALSTHLLGLFSALFYPILVWIVVANGVRYGIPYLLFAMLLGVASLLFVIRQSASWEEHIALGSGLAIGLVVLPSLYIALVNQLHRVQAQLEAELAKSVHAANHDSLTGLRNRASFLELLELEIKRSSRYPQSLILLFIDLNGFKQINDKLGHAVGDHVLAEVSEALARSVRETDHAARLGGDEFAVLLLGPVTEDDRARVCRRIRHEIGHVPLPPHAAQQDSPEPSSRGAGGLDPIGASIGIARFPEDAQTAEALMLHADRAMYAEKARGAGPAAAQSSAG